MAQLTGLSGEAPQNDSELYLSTTLTLLLYMKSYQPTEAFHSLNCTLDRLPSLSELLYFPPVETSGSYLLFYKRKGTEHRFFGIWNRKHWQSGKNKMRMNEGGPIDKRSLPASIDPTGMED